MNSGKTFLSLLVASLIGGVLTLGGYKIFFDNKQYQSFDAQQKSVLARYYVNDTSGVVVPQGLNFIYASNVVRPTVVHIKTTYPEQNNMRGFGNPYSQDPFFRFFFDEPGDGQRLPPRQSSGSGVIISADGYIVTNNHVIDGASKVEVVLDDKRKYEAKVVGRDPETDLALLKIEEKNLPFVKYGNSETVKVGEWVLACGNPFDLTSTITAGIVSAKGRNIDILRNKTNFAIESFIQTDAAVNPGNSGGALVNLKGELIGINTAIATPTGAYAGYSFAVPVALVKKVMDDLLNYGEVQRALLGVMIQDVTAELAKEKSINEIKGVYISGVNDGSAAKDAGLKDGDVILKIDDKEVNSVNRLQETVAQYRPGDKVKVIYSRNNEKKIATVTLKNKRGTYKIMKQASQQMIEDLGVQLEPVKKEEAEKLNIDGGLKVTALLDGPLKETGVKTGFIITKIDKFDVKTVKDITDALQSRNEASLIEGIYPDGKKGYYAIGW
ncbi:MAG: Do family serine endopeptidase [Cytophagales bacterium]|nr:Do family serine endopeptidase [Cytophagales bacterium]